jgi:hypothetical protein
LGEWSLIEKQEESPEAASPSQGSLAWRFASPKQSVMLQVDYPFLGWNDPSRALQRQAWSVAGEQIEFTEDRPEWPVYEAELENDLGGRVYLFASFIDDSLKPFEAVPSFAQEKNSDGRQTVLDILRGKRRLLDQTTIQIRMICESGEPMTRPELVSLRKQFNALRELFLAGEAGTQASESSESGQAEAAEGGQASSSASVEP